MIIDVPIWRNADLIRIIPITRADLNQAISRNDFRPEDTVGDAVALDRVAGAGLAMDRAVGAAQPTAAQGFARVF